MKLLIVTSHFFPETFRANDLAFELNKRGHKITVLAPIPDYPEGKFYTGYGLFKRRVETINGIKIIRTIITPRRNASPFWLCLNYISHTFFSSVRAFRLAFQEKFDAIIVHETSPVFIGIPAILVKKIQKIPVYFWVLDLWPESLSAAGEITNKQILSLAKSITNWLYKNSHTILISSQGFRQSICKLGNYNTKIKYFPNWIDNISNKEHILNNNIYNFPKGFNVVFTGNIGESQDMPHILDAAKRLHDYPINFILVGNGRKKEFVTNYIKKHNLKNVFLPGEFPRHAMPWFYKNASILLLALKNKPIFELTVPAKLQSYMDAGKPIVAMINGESAELIKHADCGWSVPAEDSKALADLLIKLSQESPEILSQKGLNGQKFSAINFNLQNCIDNLENHIDNQST